MRSNLVLLEGIGHGRRALTGGDASVVRSRAAIRCACGWQGPWRMTTDPHVVEAFRDDHLGHVVDTFPGLAHLIDVLG